MLTYLYLSLGTFLASVLCELFLLKKSLVGSMVETEKRERGIGILFAFHIFFGMAQFILAIFGLFIISARSYVPCAQTLQGNTHDLILLSVVVITQLVDISSLVCCCYTFSSKKDGIESSLDDAASASKFSERGLSIIKFMQICSCNIFGGSDVQGGLQAVAVELTNFFHHDGFLDVVPSDVLAGLILLRAQQRARKSASLKSENYSVTSIKGSANSVKSAEFGSNDSMGRKSANSVDGVNLMKGAKDMKNEVKIQRDEKTDPSLSPNKNVLSPNRKGNVFIEESIEESDTQSPDDDKYFSERSILTRRNLDIQNYEDRMLVNEAANYAVYMIAIYTHLMAMYVQPCSGVWSLCCASMSRGCKCLQCCISDKSAKGRGPTRDGGSKGGAAGRGVPQWVMMDRGECPVGRQGSNDPHGVDPLVDHGNRSPGSVTDPNESKGPMGSTGLTGPLGSKYEKCEKNDRALQPYPTVIKGDNRYFFCDN